MNLNQFVTKFNGKYVDWDKHYGYQCTDLARQYINDVLGFSPYVALPAGATAKVIFNNFRGNQYLKKVINNPRDKNQVPPVGAIIFWGWRWPITGSAGHVAIVTSAIKGQNNITVFNQNYPTGKPCLLKNFSYSGILGWLVSTK